MKTGDIVVYKPRTLPINWPDNIRDGVVTELPDKYTAMVRPYGSHFAFKCRRCELRIILPNRLRKDRPLPPLAPTKEINKNRSGLANNSEYQTYMGWKALGRYVRKGERHQKRTDSGECLFHKEQTNKQETSYRGYGRGRTHAYQTFDDEWYQERTRKEEYPHEVNRTRSTGMGGPYWRIEMSDGSIKEEHIGEDDTPPGLSLGM